MIRYMEIDGTRVSSVGLGCSRFGSLRGASTSEAVRVIRLALDFGVSVFDTAASYGQGDSERILAQALPRQHASLIITKIGKRVPLSARAMQPVKPLLRRFLRESTAADGAAKQWRGDSLGTSFEPTYLRRSVEGCLRRLRCERVPAMLLHSPSVEDLREGTAIDVLVEAQARGEVGIVGASVDDVRAANLVLEDPRIAMIQVPPFLPEGEFSAWCSRARAAGKFVVVRELFRGIGSLPREDRAPFARATLRRHADSYAANVYLVGTTRADHLAELLTAESGGNSSA